MPLATFLVTSTPAFAAVTLTAASYGHAQEAALQVAARDEAAHHMGRPWPRAPLT
jgi:hypothetical protein